MRVIRKRTVCAANVAICALLFAACLFLLSSCAASGKTVAVGVLTDIEGFSSVDRNTGEASGFEVDVAREAVARACGGTCEVEFIGVSGAGREPMLSRKTVDLVVACYTVTDNRLDTYNLSSPYYTDDLRIMVRRDSSIETVADLEGKTVGVLRGSPAQSDLLAFASLHGVEFFVSAEYDTFEEICDALRVGVVDAFAEGEAILGSYDDDSSKIMSMSFASLEYGIATRKDDDEFSQKIDDAVVSMVNDGTIAELERKWNLTEGA